MSSIAAKGFVMHLCSLEIREVNYASLCDHRTMQAFLSSVTHAIGAQKKAEPHLWELAIQKPHEHTLLWVLALAPRGSIVLEASLSGEAKGSFTLNVCSTNPVEKKRILAVVEKTFCERDSTGMRTAKRLVKAVPV